jgi:hypothetical protein
LYEDYHKFSGGDDDSPPPTPTHSLIRIRVKEQSILKLTFFDFSYFLYCFIWYQIYSDLSVSVWCNNTICNRGQAPDQSLFCATTLHVCNYNRFVVSWVLVRLSGIISPTSGDLPPVQWVITFRCLKNKDGFEQDIFTLKNA